MEKEDFIPKVEEESSETKELNKINKKFDSFLSKEYPHYEKKMGFGLSYSLSEDYFKIKIFPINGSNSKKYFMFHFETECGQGKLEKFAKENNIGLITY